VNTLQEMVTILREQLADARERERDHRAQIAQLTHMLDQSQQRYDRLLEAPAPTAAPAPASRPRWPADIHQRILDYMRTHPGPHSPSEVQDALELPNTLRHIMRHMADNDQLTRPAPGLYAYPDSDRE
jgi:hypothetical protein